MTGTLGLPFAPVLAYLLAYLGIPLADAINIVTDLYESMAEWLRWRTGVQEIGVQSQMSTVSRMLLFIGVLSNFDACSLKCGPHIVGKIAEHACGDA